MNGSDMMSGQMPDVTSTADEIARQDWVSAGQALQRVMLLATSCRLGVALHSQPLEVPQLRDFIKAQFCDGAYPQMVLRFSVTDQTAISVRRPVEDVLF